MKHEAENSPGNWRKLTLPRAREYCCDEIIFCTDALRNAKKGRKLSCVAPQLFDSGYTRRKSRASAVARGQLSLGKRSSSILVELALSVHPVTLLQAATDTSNRSNPVVEQLWLGTDYQRRRQQHLRVGRAGGFRHHGGVAPVTAEITNVCIDELQHHDLIQCAEIPRPR